MKQEITLSSGKVIELPCRMFKAEDLESMGIPHVEKKILFNKRKKGERIQSVEKDVQKKMGVVDYPDCSSVTFSDKKLREVAKEQLQSSNDNDFVWLSYFKNETDFDVRKKLVFAEELRLITDKEIVVEISYKSGISVNELVQASDSFDSVALFYGVHFGRPPSFFMICEKIMEIKDAVMKRVFCTGVPLMFSEDRRNKASCFLPLWSLICDGWIKNWKTGEGAKEIRAVDRIDLKNKNYQGWLEAGHLPNEFVPQANTNTYSLLNEKSKEAGISRENYRKAITDEVISEIEALTFSDIENWVWNNVPPIYHSVILGLYREKLILALRTVEWLNHYSAEEKQLIEKEFRTVFSPLRVGVLVKDMKLLIQEEKLIPVSELVERTFSKGRE